MGASQGSPVGQVVCWSRRCGKRSPNGRRPNASLNRIDFPTGSVSRDFCCGVADCVWVLLVVCHVFSVVLPSVSLVQVLPVLFVLSVRFGRPVLSVPGAVSDRPLICALGSVCPLRLFSRFRADSMDIIQHIHRTRLETRARRIMMTMMVCMVLVNVIILMISLAGYLTRRKQCFPVLGIWAGSLAPAQGVQGRGVIDPGRHHVVHKSFRQFPLPQLSALNCQCQGFRPGIVAPAQQKKAIMASLDVILPAGVAAHTSSPSWSIAHTMVGDLYKK